MRYPFGVSLLHNLTAEVDIVKSSRLDTVSSPGTCDISAYTHAFQVEWRVRAIQAGNLRFYTIAV